MPPPADGSQVPPRAQAIDSASAGPASPLARPERPRRTYASLWGARLEMMRPGNGAMAALGVLVGIVVAADGPVAPVAWLAAPLAAFLVSGFGNVVNDLADAPVDARAHPARPLPSGRITAGEARLWAALLLAFGLWQAHAAAGWATLAFAAANALLLGCYEAWLKRAGLPGNLLVAALVASTFAFGAVAAGRPAAGWGVLWLLMAMAFLANAAREVLKDVEDQDADRGERRTLPLQAGPGVARLLAFALVNAAVLLSILAFLRPPAGWWFPWLGLLAAADGLFVLGAALAWVDASRAQRALKLAMVAALGAFLAGPLVPH